MRLVALVPSLLTGCLMGPYDDSYAHAYDNPELRRSSERIVLCDNGGFVAELGGRRTVGNRADLDFGRRHVGALPSGERAFSFVEDGLAFTSPELGGDWTLEEERWDKTAQAEVLAACTELETQPWFGIDDRIAQPLAVQKLIFPYGSLAECIADPLTPTSFDPEEYCYDRLLLCPDGSWQARGGYRGANDIARFAATYTYVFGELAWADTGGFGQMTGVYHDGTLTTSIYRDWQLQERWDVVSPSAIGFGCR